MILNMEWYRKLLEAQETKQVRAAREFLEPGPKTIRFVLLREAPIKNFFVNFFRLRDKL